MQHMLIVPFTYFLPEILKYLGYENGNENDEKLAMVRRVIS